MIGITDPAPLVYIALGGKPSSVAVVGSAAYVGLNSSESFTGPSRVMKAIAVPSGEEIISCAPSGQPEGAF